MPAYEDPPEVPEDVTALTVSGNVVLYGTLPVGEFDPDAGLLVLDLGWCRLGRLGLQVRGDPTVDRTRSGFVLDRLVQ